MFLNFNGEVREDGEALLRADNRGFRYGDGLFETMFVRGGKVRLGDYHFQRLTAGMRLLRLEFRRPLSLGMLEGMIGELIVRNGMVGEGWRGRLTVFRNSAGMYNELDREAGFCIQVGALANADSTVRRRDGLVLDVFSDGRKACDAFSGIKSNNYLLSTQAGIFAAERGLDDCLLLNGHGRIAETTVANIWWIKEGRIGTPPLSEGCVAGVMRRWLLEALPAAGYVVQEEPIGPEQLMKADEIFLSNAIRGVEWVRDIAGHSFTGQQAAVISGQIISKI